MGIINSVNIDEGNPVVFGSGNKIVYFEKVFNDNYYVLGFNFDFFKARGLKQDCRIIRLAFF